MRSSASHHGLGEAIEVGTVEQLRTLRGFPGAARLELRELAVLASIARARAVPRGASIVRAGDPVGAIYFPVAQPLTVVCRGVETQVGPGTAIGVAHAFAGERSDFDCEASEESVVLRLALEDLEDVFEDFPLIMLAALRDLAARAIALDGRAAAPERVPFHRDRELDFVERLLILRADPMLGGGGIDGVARLATAATEQHPEAGATLFDVEQLATSIHLVIRGHVICRTPGGDETRRGPGSGLGMLECFAGWTHGSTAIAGEDVAVLALDRDAVMDAFEDHPDLALCALAGISRLLLPLG